MLATMAIPVSNPAVQRRLIFATQYLPHDLPNYWEIIARFSSQLNTEESCITPEAARLAMENMQALNADAFIYDTDLTNELLQIECTVTKLPLGIPLMPNQTHCVICEGKLLLRGDRASRISLYTESLGTAQQHIFTSIVKTTEKCKFVQYYGYHKNGRENSQYSSNWNELPYFILSQETGFEMKFLKHFDVELLIGQLSYKQRTDIYNVTKGYDTTTKVVRTNQRSIDKVPPVHGYDLI